MTPGYRIASPLGDIVLRAEDDYLTGLFFVGQKYFPALPICSAADPVPPLVETAQREIAEYFAGIRTVFSVPVRLHGTPFQHRVWDALLSVPCGTVITYGALTTRIGLTADNARAVGNAVGKNPVSIMVPCHRIVGSTGKLTGYAGGLDRKAALLSLETACAPFQLECSA